MISPETIKKLSNLARVNISEEEQTTLAVDMENILGYVKQIQEVSAGTEIDPNKTEAKEKTRNVFRDDANPHESGIHTEAILNEAPQREGQYVKVKKILS